jgi:mycothiol synthase
MGSAVGEHLWFPCRRGSGTLTAVTQLPAGYEIRPATLDPSDVDAILALWIDVDIAALGFPDTGIEDVRNELTDPRRTLSVDSWLVHAPDGRLVAYATVLDLNESDQVDADVYLDPGLAPTADGDAVAAFLLARIEQRAAEMARLRDLPAAKVSFIVPTTEAELRRWVAAAGYENVRRFNRMEIELTGEERPPDLAPGVRIRVADASEQGRRTVHRLLFAAFAEHFGTAYEPYEAWSARMQARPSADPGQWWLIEIDGEPVGLAMGDEQYADENGGWVKNLGVLNEHRGHGFGRALLQHALASFAARGRTKAGLGVDTGNETGALALYESVGMRPLFQADVWQRRVPVTVA